jgi:uncharacterized protein
MTTHQTALADRLERARRLIFEPGREWVVKVSKFCNLRCKYCYEWNGLADRERMSLDLWARIFESVRNMSERTEATVGRPPTDIIVWHGGEPTILPLDYLEAVMRLQREIFPTGWFVQGRIKNRLQTNLFSLPEEKLQFLKRHDFGIGVSFDVVPGARVDMVGQPTERRVLANISRLQKAGINPGLLVVIAAHTAEAIDRVYDFLRDRNVSCRLLPLFNGPDERPMDEIGADRGTINAALIHMFARWFEDGAPFQIRLFDEYLNIVVTKMLGLTRDLKYDRRVIGDKILVVNLDGRVYQPCTNYSAEFALGNLATQTIDELLTSDSYARSLDRDDEIRRTVCERCEYFAACGAKEMFMVDDGGANAGRCVTAQPLCRSIEAYLNERGINETMLGELLPGSLELAACA